MEMTPELLPHTTVKLIIDLWPEVVWYSIHLMFEHGVCCGQSKTSTEFHDKAPLGFRSVCPYHTPTGFSRWQLFQDTTQTLQKGLVICTTVWCISNNHRLNLFHSNLKSHEGNPLIHKREFKHTENFCPSLEAWFQSQSNVLRWAQLYLVGTAQAPAPALAPSPPKRLGSKSLEPVRAARSQPAQFSPIAWQPVHNLPNLDVLPCRRLAHWEVAPWYKCVCLMPLIIRLF